MPFLLHLKHYILNNNLTSHLFMLQNLQNLLKRLNFKGYTWLYGSRQPSILTLIDIFFHLETGTCVQTFCIIYLSCIILHCYFLLDWSSVAQITKSPFRLFILKYTVYNAAEKTFDENHRLYIFCLCFRTKGIILIYLHYSNPAKTLLHW